MAPTNAVVMGNGLPAIEPRNKDGISENAIRDQLSRILESSIFVQSERLGQFLRFTVQTTLERKAETLKVYVVGTRFTGASRPINRQKTRLTGARLEGFGASCRNSTKP
jgi:hypothetical protein